MLPRRSCISAPSCTGANDPDGRLGLIQGRSDLLVAYDWEVDAHFEFLRSPRFSCPPRIPWGRSILLSRCTIHWKMRRPLAPKELCEKLSESEGALGLSFRSGDTAMVMSKTLHAANDPTRVCSPLWLSSCSKREGPQLDRSTPS